MFHTTPISLRATRTFLALDFLTSLPDSASEQNYVCKNYKRKANQETKYCMLKFNCKCLKMVVDTVKNLNIILDKLTIIKYSHTKT